MNSGESGDDLFRLRELAPVWLTAELDWRPVTEIANPYSAPSVADPHVREPDSLVSTGVAKSFMKWGAICYVSAVPSFWAGLMTGSTFAHVSAMVLGILCFVVAYTYADVTYIRHAISQNRRLRTALRIGYGTRLVISIIVPVGLMVDLWFGILSIGIVSHFTGPIMQMRADSVADPAQVFPAVFATTLIQGVLVNIVPAGYMAAVYAVLSLWDGKSPTAAR